MVTQRRKRLPRAKRAGVTQEELRKIARMVGDEPETPRRLREIYERAANVMRRDAIKPWLLGKSRLLDDKRPVDVLKAGGYQDVLDAIDAIGEGVFV